jgi:DNA-binding NtrC family response regulator
VSGESRPGAAYRPRPAVLVVDDDPAVQDALREILRLEFDVLTVADGAAALEVLRTRRVDVVFLDVRLPGEPGPAVLPRLLALDDAVAVVLMTALPDVRTAVDCMKLGAVDYLVKPFEVEHILRLARSAVQHRFLEAQVEYLRAELHRQQGFETLVGRHPAMVRLYERIAQVAPTHATVLITGESGTGKELVARAIHAQSPRRDQAFVAVNLAAIPDGLVESELFGHERGAFTGAHARRLGRFELAHGGTLFLDEVPSLRLDLQAKLLRALQEREIERLGGQRTLPVDVRVIAATNVDLRALVKNRAFRGDLYYRLAVVPLTVPPLRERKEDIPLLVEHFARKYAREFKKDVRGVSQSALPVLLGYDWPGNVRELENVIERGVALATRPVVRLEDLPLDLALHDAGGDETEPLALAEARDRFERVYILRTLERESWNQSRAARSLGIHRNTLLARLAGWGIRREDGEPMESAPDADTA